MRCLKAKYVTIRKEQMCFGCMRKFPSKTSMYCLTNITDAGFHTFYMCDICLEEVETWPEWTDEGIFEGDVINNMPELFIEAEDKPEQGCTNEE